MTNDPISNVEILRSKLELAIGYLENDTDKKAGDFYLMGSLPAVIKWADSEEEESAMLMGRVVLRSIRGGRLRDLLGTKGDVSKISKHVDDALIVELIEGFDEQLKAIYSKRRLYGRDLDSITL